MPHAPAPDVPRAAAEAQAVIRQIAAHGPQVGLGELEITLRPEELGRLRLVVHDHAGQTSLYVTADRPETLDLLRRHTDLLMQEFRNQGFGALNVSVGGGARAVPLAKANPPMAPPRPRPPPGPLCPFPPPRPRAWPVPAKVWICVYERYPMTTVAPLVGPATAVQQGVAPPASPQANATALSSDFETFLKMLTVQMQNQDPLNPIDSTEYAMQLATFSSVEQQVLTNDLLRQMMGGQGAGLLDAARLIGQQVALAGPVPFQGAAVQMWAAPQPGASRAQLVVRDITGTEVARQSVAPDQGLLEWNGRTSTGQQAMAGSYLMTVEAWAGDVPLQPQPAQAYATVTELRDSALGVQVVTQTGAVAALSTVTAIRQGG